MLDLEPSIGKLVIQTYFRHSEWRCLTLSVLFVKVMKPWILAYGFVAVPWNWTFPPLLSHLWLFIKMARRYWLGLLYNESTVFGNRAAVQHSEQSNLSGWWIIRPSLTSMRKIHLSSLQLLEKRGHYAGSHADIGLLPASRSLHYSGPSPTFGQLMGKSAHAAWWITPHRFTSYCHVVSHCCRYCTPAPIGRLFEWRWPPHLWRAGSTDHFPAACRAVV
jgi:hypothetical protein